MLTLFSLSSDDETGLDSHPPKGLQQHAVEAVVLSTSFKEPPGKYRRFFVGHVGVEIQDGGRRGRHVSFFGSQGYFKGWAPICASTEHCQRQHGQPNQCSWEPHQPGRVASATAMAICKPVNHHFGQPKKMKF
jgi:hypothetical protein